MSVLQDVVASNVKKLIQGKGITQKVIAEEIDLSEKQLSALLCGRKRITTSIVLKFCEVLQTTPNELYGFDSK